PRVRVPAHGLAPEVCATSGRQGVILGLSAGVRFAPFLGDQAASLEAVEGGVERALLHRERVLRGFTYPPADRVSVARAPRERLEDQDVERSGEQVGAGHSFSLSKKGSSRNSGDARVTTGKAGRMLSPPEVVDGVRRDHGAARGMGRL